MIVLQPYEYHANTSELIRILKKGHYNVKLTDAEWKSLYNWIDYNAPDKGSFDATRQNGFDQIARRIELADKYNNAGVDWKSEIASYAEYLKGKGEIKPVMTEKVAPAKTQEV